MRLLIILLILLAILGGSGAYTYNTYGAWSFSPVGVLLIVILVVWFVRWRR